MSLFEPFTTLREAEPTRPLVVTPFGTMAFQALERGTPLALAEALVDGDGIELRRYERASADIELLLLSFAPKIPAHMRVDGCVAAVWRIAAKEDGAALAFRAAWELGARSDDGGPNPGEHLTALTWYAPDALASLGTSDEEMMSYAARQRLLPERLAPTFESDQAIYTRYVGERDGLEIELPPLLAGESAQTHMVLAWVTGELNQWECSPWFAVDVAPEEIARIADEALGRLA